MSAVAAGDATAQAAGRALSSPLRMRMLRFCLHEARTNREIADEFELNPGTSLHHVRTLVDTGFLAAEPARIGRRGAREVPYRATGTSWATDVPGLSPVLVQTFLDELQGVPADDIVVVRIGFKFTPDTQEALTDELVDVITRYKDRGPDDDGRPISLMLAVHPEVRRLDRDGAARRSDGSV